MRRTTVVATPGTRLTVSLGCLMIERESSAPSRVPFEDLDCLILETTALTTSASVFIHAVKNNCVVLVCDERHSPSGILLPLNGNSLIASRQRAQAKASLPIQKNLWRQIVQAKLANQASNLQNSVSKRRLEQLRRRVRSGDGANVEATAAREYWPAWANECALTDFRRGDDTHFCNGLLDYGYAILRAATARALCAAGLNPVLGIHHHDRSNALALADDLMEPYRPWVDQMVARMIRDGVVELSIPAKRWLQGLLAERACEGDQMMPLGVAIETAAGSLANSLTGSMLLDSTLTARGIARELRLAQLPEATG